MARCELQIVLDRPDGRYQPGEAITGRVLVSVGTGGSVECRGLRIEPVLRVAPDRLPPLDYPRQGTELFVGSWEPGQQRYPFTLQAPAGPLDYRGSTLGLSWSLRATADLSRASDATADRDFALVMREGAGTRLRFWGGRLNLAAGQTSPVVAHILLTALWVAPLVPVVMSIMGGTFGWLDALLCGVSALLLAFHVAFVVLWLRARNLRTCLRGPWPDLGQPEDDVNEVLLSPPGIIGPDACLLGHFLLRPHGDAGYREASAGEPSWDFALAVNPESGFTEVEATLEVDEVVVVYEQKANQSYAKPVEHVHPLLVSPIALKATQPGVVAGRLVPPAPGTAPYSWGKDGHHQIRWRIALSGAMPGEDDRWTGRVRLIADSEPAAASPERAARR